MKREDIINELVNQDVNDITQSIFQDDWEFLIRVLKGEGFTGYTHLSDKQLVNEYNDRLLPDDVEPIKII